VAAGEVSGVVVPLRPALPGARSLRGRGGRLFKPPRDARLYQIAFLASLLTFGALARDFTLHPAQMALAFLSGLATQALWLRALGLEQKGYLTHTKSKEGRAFIYEPVVGRKQARTNAMRHLISRFFGNSPESLVLNLLEDEELSGGELRRIRTLLAGGEKR